jgi:hypothetical protein
MKKLHYYLIFFLMLLISESLFAQSKDPDVILKEVLNKFKSVEDYVVDVEIKIDVDFLKVPDTKATIYFKQPDKIHFESEGFALLPKEGMDFSPASLLKKEYTAIYEREAEIGGIPASVVKVIPLGETDEVILTTLWIDQKRDLIRKVESTTKTTGTFSIELSYEEKETEYPLPSKMLFQFNVDKMEIPKSISGDINGSTRLKEKKPRDTTGKVLIQYSDYKVNTGLSDKIFEKKEK